MESSGIIEKIRNFNRFYTRILGLLDNKILKTDYSLLEARILFELYYKDSLSSSDLVKELNIDPSYLSRIIRKFEKNGLLNKARCSEDSRRQILNLTENGENELIYLQDISNNHIKSLLENVSDNDKDRLLEAMINVRIILSGEDRSDLITIRNHQMGDVGYLIFQHARFYSKEYGFDITFESYVAGTMIKFIDNYNENKERLWIAEKENRIVGSIAIVYVSDNVAQLRWFLIESELRGRGIGKKLITTAIDFCREKKYEKIMLMTSSELAVARALYSKNGFKITKTKSNRIWGQQLNEEIWELELNN